MPSKNDLEQRTLVFAWRLIDLIASFPKTPIGQIIGTQLLSAGTSIGANYREAARGQTKADFIHKAAICEKEAAETNYWLEICSRQNIGSPKLRETLLRESTELLAIFVTIGKNAKK